MATLDFFFDPGCPWTWLTSRWVVEVAPQRSVPVRWRAFSRDINKGALPTITQEALRVVEAVWADHGDAPIGRLYTEMGTRFVVERDLTTDALAAAIEAAGLDAKYVDAAGDERWDAEIRWSMNEAIEVVGDDVAIPILVFGDGDGRAGISGPVMSRAPTGHDAVAFWDHVVAVAWWPGFFELKRSRGQLTEPPR